MVPKCPFCESEVTMTPIGTLFACPVCKQSVGVRDDGELVKASPDTRKPWVKPRLK